MSNKFEIENLNELVREIRDRFKKDAKVYIPKLKEVRNVLENSPSPTAAAVGAAMKRVTPGNTVFACFQGSTPITAEEYKNRLYQAFSKGSNAEIEQLVLVEKRYLKKYYPDEYEAWEKLPEAQRESTWSGSKSILSAMNKELKTNAVGGGALINTTSNEYAKSIAQYSLPNTLPMQYTDKVPVDPASINDAWIYIANQFIEKYFKKDSLNYIGDAAVNPFNSTKTISIDCVDSENKKFALQGIIFYNSNFGTIKLNLERGVKVFKSVGSVPTTLTTVPIKEVNVGHTEEGASQSIYYNYRALVKLKDEFRREGDDESKNIAELLEKEIAKLQPLYERAYVADRIILDQTALAKVQDDPSLYDKIIGQFQAQALATNAKQLIIVAYNSTNQNFEMRGGKPVDQHFELNSNVFFLQDEKENTLRGSGRSGARRKAFQDLMTSLANQLAIAFAFMEGSSSPLEQALLLGLQEALEPLVENKAISKKIVKRSRKRIPLVNQKSQMRSKKTDVNKALAIKKTIDARIKKSIKDLSKKIIAEGKKSIAHKNKASRVRGTTPLVNTQQKINHDNSIVTYLNDRIRESVIAQMRRPALQNRTGRFASSVKITSATERAINYSYLRDPYRVFSRRSGTPPWNTVAERDPHLIIQKAIKAITSLGPDQNIRGTP